MINKGLIDSGIVIGPPFYGGMLLKTGQLTCYAIGDDGDKQKGITKGYDVKTTGQFAGTTNIDLIHLTSALISFSIGTKQVETATVVATITTAGNATITVTAVGMTNSPKAISVAVALNDTGALVAGKVRTALAADSDVSAFFTVSGATDQVILTAKVVAANDATMNIASADGTCVGITAAPTSANTAAGDVIQRLTATGLMGVFLAAGGDIIVVTGSASNNGTYTISSATADVVVVTTPLVTEAAGPLISIAKREAHSNNCVLDNNTGLMWSRYVSGKMGTASDGKMPWTGQLYDIFAYAAAANAASLGGYADWRIPNDIELVNLRDMEATTAAPNATAFPSWPTSDYFWSSTTRPTYTPHAMIVEFSDGGMGVNTKTATYFVSLVRGG